MMSSFQFRRTLLVSVLLTMVAELAFAAPSTLTFEKVQEFGPQHFDSTTRVPTLTMGKDGNLYGTAHTIVFRIDRAGVLSTYHTSTNGNVARLVVGNDGLLYGFAAGTDAEVPVFFRLDYQGNYTSLLELPAVMATDLVVGSDGAFYGGTHWICDECFRSGGPMIRITSSGAYTLLAPTSVLAPTSGGAGLMYPQVVGSDGALYGIQATRYEEFGWGNAEGSILFRLDTAGNFTTFYQMTTAQGFFEHLTLGSNGLLYATSYYGGGPNSYGRLIGLDNTGAVAVTHNFDWTAGANPIGSLTVGGDGAIYGVTEHGGPEVTGTVYRIDSAGTFTSLHSFPFSSGNPQQGLVLAKDWALYGFAGSAPFRVDSAGTVSYPPIPVSPVSPLVQGSDCALYGAATVNNDTITVYRLFEPGHLCQTIEFGALADRTLYDPPFTLSASASSGLPVSFSASGRCWLRGDRLFLKRGVGVCRVTAYQDGDSRFQAAEDVTQEFRVRPPRRMRGLR